MASFNISVGNLLQYGATRTPKAYWLGKVFHSERSGARKPSKPGKNCLVKNKPGAVGNMLELRLSIYKNKLHVQVSLKLLTCTCGGIHQDGLSRQAQFDRPHLEWRHSRLNGPVQAHYKLSYYHFSFFRSRRLTAWREVPDLH